MKLTPTEDLIMEVLAARHRLGEHLWTFDSRNKRAIDSLEEKGLVMGMHGVVENTVRAVFTTKGREMYVKEGYIAPIFRTKKKWKQVRGW